MKLKIHYSPFLLLLFLSQYVHAQTKLTSYVNPFIGTAGNGHAFPGATVPFGMVQLSPDNGKDGLDWSSGYHYDDDVIAGFSHIHLSGMMVGDGLDISVMPLISPLSGDEELVPVKFNHQNEKAFPGYYSVELDNGIGVELTTTERVGYHRYHFPQGSQPTIHFDLASRHNADIPTETFVTKLNDSTIVGYRYSTGWVKRVYFAARTSKAMNSFTLKDDIQIETGEIALSLTSKEDGRGVAAQLIFDEIPIEETIEMKVALSMTSTEKALIALEEVPSWSFTAVQTQADRKWQQELEKVQVQTKNEKLKQIFYTALYHTAISQITSSDIDEVETRYIPYSLGTSYNVLYPLISITQPERYIHVLNSILSFDCDTTERYSTLPILANAILKDWPGLDKNSIYDTMKEYASTGGGIPLYIQYGYVPQDKLEHSVSLTLAYAFNDYNIAQVAKKLGNATDYEFFLKRAGAYAHIFDATTGFIRAKNSDGSWAGNFDSTKQYSYTVPYDVLGLSGLYGKDGLEQKLDSLFTAPSVDVAADSSDHKDRLLGQYAHANPANQHIAYMYSFFGKPWKTQERIRQLVDVMYQETTEGYAGNEHAGQMSAWAIWSIAGLYPVNAASGQYVIGSPSADEVLFQLVGGKTFTSKALNNSADNRYIQSVTLNGEPYNKTYISHQDILKGGEIVFQMGPHPNKEWGKEQMSWPASAASTQFVQDQAPRGKSNILEKVKDIFKNL